MLRPMFAVASVAFASALVVPTVSQAEASHSVRVSYAGLNLGSSEGQSTLQRRIVYAARIACEIEDSRELALASATRQCRNDAVAGAQPAYQAALNEARHPSVTVGGAVALIVAAA